MKQRSKLVWKENRAVAACVLCTAVLLSVLGIGGWKVQRIVAAVNNTYAQTLAVEYGQRQQAADSIIQVGRAMLAPDDTALMAAQQAWTDAGQANTPQEQFVSGAALQSKIGLLYETLHAQMDEKKGDVLQTQWSEFSSRCERLNRKAEAYNEAARTAQKKLAGFPASLLVGLTGADVSQYAT